MKRRTRKLLILPALILLGAVLYLLPPNLSSLRPGITIERVHYDSLMALKEMAERRGEYPVSAVLLYGDSVIGAGINSFRTQNDPLGHAEINAFLNAFSGMHYFDFRSLSRDSLILLTSHEPCPMCKGVINHLDVRKIYYLQPKKFSYRNKYRRKELSFNLKTRRIKVPEDQ